MAASSSSLSLALRAIQLDNFTTEEKKRYVAASVAVGALISTVSFVLRIWARALAVRKLHREDWFMCAAMLLSYCVGGCLIWGMFDFFSVLLRCYFEGRLGYLG